MGLKVLAHGIKGLGLPQSFRQLETKESYAKAASDVKQWGLMLKLMDMRSPGVITPNPPLALYTD